VALQLQLKPFTRSVHVPPCSQIGPPPGSLQSSTFSHLPPTLAKPGAHTQLYMPGESLQTVLATPAQILASTAHSSMFLQPIVENAVKHGIEPRMTGGVVQVQVQREQQTLIFAVTDDGVGFTPEGKENIGLGAVRERLAVQYGDAASLNIERTADDLTRVTIRIPFPSSSPA